jgi:hypothetical protein
MIFLFPHIIIGCFAIIVEENNSHMLSITMLRRISKWKCASNLWFSRSWEGTQFLRGERAAWHEGVRNEAASRSQERREHGHHKEKANFLGPEKHSLTRKERKVAGSWDWLGKNIPGVPSKLWRCKPRGRRPHPHGAVLQCALHDSNTPFTTLL